MRKIFTLIILSAIYQFADAQPFNNEWINPQKTYYKFYIAGFGSDREGVPVRRGPVRIYQSTLQAAGFQNIVGKDLQLWKDGQEVAAFVSNSGSFSSTDFIEFWGEIATGKTDRDLYEDSSYQLSDTWNLYTDSAAYFLTSNPGNNLRINAAINDLGKATIAADRNFLFDTARYYRDELNEGYGVFIEQKLYQSSFSANEGWTSRAIRRNTSMPQNFPQLYADSTEGGASCYFSVAGNSPQSREVRLTLNGDTLARFSLEGFDSRKLFIPIGSTLLRSGTAGFRIENLSTNSEDEIKAGTLQIFYPRLFNFGGNARFEFKLFPSDSGRYLKIANFDYHQANVVLLDLQNRQRYLADTTLKDTIRFYLPPSKTGYQLALFKDDAKVIKVVSQVDQKSFVDFSALENQGDFLIISNKTLINSVDNSVNDYAAYRRSDSGGSFNAKVIGIEELCDQFAFGVQMHPLGIKNFLQFARSRFATVPAYVFLIGKGVSYTGYRPYGNSEFTRKISLVPVFGSPGSDNLLSSNKYEAVPATPIGRLSAVSGEEVKSYLQKVRAFERSQQSDQQDLDSKGWMKKVLQLVGVNDLTIGATIDSMTSNYRAIISDTAFGADVTTFSKYADSANYPNAVIEFGEKMNAGCGILEYFGHSSSSNIDFNLDNPANYNNYGKYPLMIVNGCKAGNIFDYEAGRLSVRSSLSEKFVLENEKGAIGYLSSSSFGIVDYLDIFTKNFYSAIASSHYGKGFGNITQQGIADGLKFTGNSDFYGRMHAEQFTFHGDPSVKFGGFALPDYLVDSNSIDFGNAPVLLSSDSFNIKIRLNNIGRATYDSVHVLINRTYQDGSGSVIFDSNIRPLKSVDSIELQLPVVYNRDYGKTTISVVIDPENKQPELTKSNNSASRIIEMKFPALLPVYPYNYSIINKSSPGFITASLFTIDSVRTYKFEIDTSASFNSPLKIKRQLASAGGMIEFKDVHLPVENATYFWRVAADFSEAYWSTFSFNYRPSAKEGFEQSYFFQHTGSQFYSIKPDSAQRVFDFSSSYNNLFVQHSIYPTSGLEDADFSIFLNGSAISASACVGSSIIFNVFDPLTFKPVLNTTHPYNSGPECRPLAKYNFEYSTQSAASRKNAMDFLDNYVQNGYFVIARKLYDLGNADWAPTVWAKDTAIYGNNNSLYHRLKAQGTQIDSFIYPRTFIFLFKKNDSTSFAPVSVLSKGLYDRISLSRNMQVSDTSGTIVSPLFGPAKEWSDANWQAKIVSGKSAANFSLYARTKNETDSLIYASDSLNKTVDLSALDAKAFPFVYFRMDSKDVENCTPVQLERWGSDFIPVPEGMLAPNLGADIKDSFVFKHDINVAYDTIGGFVSFKNISDQDFEPLKVKIVLYDEEGNAHIFPVLTTEALKAGMVVRINFNLDVSSFRDGKYNLMIEVNPDNDQLELYHFNNVLYKYIRIIRKSVLPVQLLNFTATKSGEKVQIAWRVDNETDVKNYDLLHSVDGKFNVLATVPSNGQRSSLTDYSYIHGQPSSGINFYKLQVNKKDVTYFYSAVQKVEMSFETVKISPNPVINLMKVAAPPELEYNLKIFDLQGKLVYSRKLKGNQNIDLSGFAAGQYLIQIIDGASSHTFKIVKQ